MKLLSFYVGDIFFLDSKQQRLKFLCSHLSYGNHMLSYGCQLLFLAVQSSLDFTFRPQTRSVLTGSCTVNLMGKYNIGLGMGMGFFASQ